MNFDDCQQRYDDMQPPGYFADEDDQESNYFEDKTEPEDDDED